jgi:hypothetical protein
MRKLETILLSSFIVTTLVLITQQQAKAAKFDSTVEKWLNGDNPKNFIATCGYSLATFPAIHYNETITINDRELAQKLADSCDNDALIIKLDMCRNHGNKFPICGEPVLTRYIQVRGLDSATVAPFEWWAISHKENILKEINDKAQTFVPLSTYKYFK